MSKRQKTDDADEAFPRSKPRGDGNDDFGLQGTRKKAKTGKTSKKDEDLADWDEDEDLVNRAKGKGKYAKKGKGKGKGKDADMMDDDLDLTEVRLKPRRLVPTDLEAGALLLAAVRTITEDELILNLPFNMVGIVHRNHATEENFVQQLPPLKALYVEGQLLVVAVLTVTDAGDQKHRIEASMRPSLINAGMDGDAVLNHMCLAAVVESEEEHVFKLSLGIPGLSGILRKNESAHFLQVPQVGAVLQVAVQAFDKASGVARCTAKPAESLRSTSLTQEHVKAGFLVQAKITETLTAKQEGKVASEVQGLAAKYCGILQAAIHNHYACEGGSIDPVASVRQMVSARVLAVLPGPPSRVYLTLLPHLVEWTPKPKELQEFGIGRRLDGEIVEMTAKYGCRLACSLPRAKSGKDEEAEDGEGLEDEPSSTFAVAGFCPTARQDDGNERPLSVGSSYPCKVLGHNYLDMCTFVTMRPSDLKKGVYVSPAELAPGQLVTGTISKVVDFGVFVKLSEFITGLVQLRHLTDVPLATPPKRFRVDQKVKCRVLRVQPERRRVDLTTKKTLLNSTFQLTQFEQGRKGMLVTGCVGNVQPWGAVVNFFGDAWGVIPQEEMEKDEAAPALGMAVKCKITGLQKKRRCFNLSLNVEGGLEPEDMPEEVQEEKPDWRAERAKRKQEQKEERERAKAERKKPMRVMLEHLSVGDIVSGRVKCVQKYGFFIRINNSKIDGLVHTSEISDTASVSLDSFPLGTDVQRAKVLSIQDGKVKLTVKPSAFSTEELAVEEEDDEKEEDEEDVPEPQPPAAKAVAPAAVPAAESDDDDVAPWAQAAAVKAVEVSTGKGAFQWSELAGAAGPAAGSDDEQMAADSDDDEDDADGGGKAQPTKRQKKAAKKAEKQELLKQEAEVAEGLRAQDPKSVEDFERLLLTEGGTSIVWIRYMAFHLKMSDMEKARAVAERAVKHVGLSEAKERFNMWVAYMNLECTYGTDKTAEAIFTRAAAHNEAKPIHLQLARIHERNGKNQLATTVYDKCSKKFGHSKKVWLAYIAFLYRIGNLETARKILPRALEALPRRKHPVVVSKCAMMEYEYGSVERGRSVFEGLLDSYPKRTDLWSVYLDAHIKGHIPPKTDKPQLSEVRNLMERCCTMKLKAVKMRFFFKRWLDFEQQWGDASSQDLVRTKAREFVESQAA